MKQQIRKDHLLEMVDMVKLQIANTWTMSSKRKQEKIGELDKIRNRIINANDSMAMVMENSMPTKCMPTMRTRKVRKDFEKQLVETVNLIDPIGASFRSDVGTIGGDSVYPKASNFSAEFDDLSLEDTATTADSNLDDSLKKDDNLFTDNNSSSDGSDDVIVNPSSLRSDDGPIGVSITTWKLHKFNKATSPMSSSERRQKFITRDKGEEFLLSKTPTIPENNAVPFHSDTESNLEEATNEDNQRDEESDTSSIEEFQITFGDGIAVQASKNKSVRFMGIKPTAEDNINRAKSLLASAKSAKKGGVYARKPRWIPK
jgi:hypothetical protein